MQPLQQNIRKSADWLIKSFRTYGKKLDYSVDSIILLEDFLDLEIDDGKPKSNGRMVSDYDKKVFAITAYLGEVIIRNTQGTEWIFNERNHQGNIDICIKSINGTVLWPGQRVTERIQQGKREDLFVYCKIAIEKDLRYNDIILHPTNQQVKPWWQFW